MRNIFVGRQSELDTLREGLDETYAGRGSLYLLGPPRIGLDGEPILVDTRKAIALLGYMAIHRERHRRDALVNLLWPEHDQAHGRAGLRRTL